MGDLPANRTNGSTHLSPERAAHREWIGGRALTLLSHYWREDDPVELTAAIGKDWADILQGIPQEYIQNACLQYLSEEPRRKPTPGEIYQRARRMMPPPRVVAHPEDPAEKERRELLELERGDPERAKRAADYIRKVGIKMKVNDE